MAFPFLNLPVELQVEVVNNISRYSELKALRLVSKTLYHITTPRFYYTVDLYTRDISGRYHVPDKIQDRQTMSKIHSLLVQPANLCFVKVLKTGWFGLKSTILMDEVLPLLRNDSLIKFGYLTHSKYCFPTPRQLESLCSRQKRLELKLYPHMISWLEKLQRKSSQNALLKSFTRIYIGDSIESSLMTPDKVCWPLKNLDLCLLKKLSFNGEHFRFSRQFLVIIDLFAGQSFVNLTELTLKNITFGKTVTFANMPRVELLVIEHCNTNMHNGLRLPLEFPEDFELQGLEFWTTERAEPLSHLLTQVRNLKNLVIRIRPSLFLSDYQAGTDFISAVMLHKDTLSLFEIIGQTQGYTILSQLFPRLHLENLPNFYYGAWSVFPQSHTIFRLSAT